MSPYIAQDRRKLHDGAIRAIEFVLDHSSVQDAAGDFTYVVYKLLKRFGPKYWMRALGIGCLVCAILEVYRMDHAPYEDTKRKDNGNVE